MRSSSWRETWPSGYSNGRRGAEASYLDLLHQLLDVDVELLADRQRHRPLVGGVIFEWAGPAVTYLFIGLLYSIAWVSVMRITPRPIEGTAHRRIDLDGVSQGVRYVLANQVMLGSMALDLFAGCIQGATALLPVFTKRARRPYRAGTAQRRADLGALLTMLVATQFPPVKHAAHCLLAVTGFGIAMIVFAVSESIYLSLFALFMSGVFDGVSVHDASSDRAVSYVARTSAWPDCRGGAGGFIGSSNEIGTFESGVAAAAPGTVRSVWLGEIRH